MADVLAPELVFGVVGPTATDLALTSTTIKEALQTVHYTSEVVRLSGLLGDVEGAPWLPLPPPHPVADRLERLMGAGNQLCEIVRRRDAMVHLGLAEINNRRIASLRAELSPEQLDELGDDATTPAWEQKLLSYRARRRHAYIIQSLKRPDEVTTLRAIYGPWFLLIAASAPEPQREDRLAAEIGKGNPLASEDQCRLDASRLINRDRNEALKDPFGQNVTKTFPMADLFVSTRVEGRMQLEILRFIELVFANRFHTPTRDEFAMCQAQANACRSADLSRQVGAVISRLDGSILAMGTNEVPKAHGGPYWEGDEPDARDFRQPGKRDPSNIRRNRLLADLLQSLAAAGQLAPATTERVSPESVAELIDELWRDPLKSALLRDVIEFQRAVHAEMGALSDAAMRGVSVEGATLFTTTFPCHLCAKHVVASGLGQVVFIEPYPKSLVNEFYPDSIELEESSSETGKVELRAFEGIAPRRYFELFTLSGGERSTSGGDVVEWETAKQRARPALGTPRAFDPPLVAIAAVEAVFMTEVGTELEKAIERWKEDA